MSRAGTNCFLSQSAARLRGTEDVADAAARAAATLASNAWSASGALALSRAVATGENAGGSNGCGCNAAVTCAATSSGLIGWLKRSTITGGRSKRPPGRYQCVCSSRAVGVVNVKEYGRSSRRPLSAAAEASILTSYFVASGSLRAGVKIRIVVPDHRKVPSTAGEI